MASYTGFSMIPTATNRVYATRETLWNAYRSVLNNIAICVGAPWLYPDNLAHPGLIESYEDEANVLPGKITTWMITSRDLKRCVVVCSEALARALHFCKVYTRYQKYVDLTAVPAEYDFDLCAFLSEA